MSSPAKPKAPAPDDLTLGLSPTNVRVLLIAMTCTVDGKIDFDLLATRGNYTRKSASVVYGTARRKLMKYFEDGNLAAGTSSVNTTVKDDADPVDSSEVPGPSPTKKRKANAKPKGSSPRASRKGKGSTDQNPGPGNIVDENANPLTFTPLNVGDAHDTAVEEKFYLLKDMADTSGDNYVHTSDSV